MKSSKKSKKFLLLGLSVVSTLLIVSSIKSATINASAAKGTTLEFDDIFKYIELRDDGAYYLQSDCTKTDISYLIYKEILSAENGKFVVKFNDAKYILAHGEFVVTLCEKEDDSAKLKVIKVVGEQPRFVVVGEGADSRIIYVYGKYFVVLDHEKNPVSLKWVQNNFKCEDGTFEFEGCEYGNSLLFVTYEGERNKFVVDFLGLLDGHKFFKDAFVLSKEEFLGI